MAAKPAADVFIVANKSWEVAPLVAVLQHTEAAPEALQNAGSATGCGTLVFTPRTTLTCGGKSVAVWCVQDLMDRGVSSSLTHEKHRVLALLAKAHDTPRVVIAVGTAAFPSTEARNGCVSLASRYFLHDPFPAGSNPHWPPPKPDKVICSPLDCHLGEVVRQAREDVELRLLQPPLRPADPPTLVYDPAGVSIGVVNVTDPKLYEKADTSAMNSFAKNGEGSAVSVETTHGVICDALGAPFLVVSGIANGIGKFQSEVVPRKYAQNFTAAHNAAICVARLLPHLVKVAG
jgi:hypothetical protein